MDRVETEHGETQVTALKPEQPKQDNVVKLTVAQNEDSSVSSQSDLHPIEKITTKIKPGGPLPPVVVHDVPRSTGPSGRSRPLGLPGS